MTAAQQLLEKFRLQHRRKCFAAVHIVHSSRHPHFIPGRAKNTQATAPEFTLPLLFLPQTSSSLHISYPPFCLPALRRVADFSQGGGMVEEGGVP